VVAQRESGLASLVTKAKIKHPWLNMVIPFVRTPADLLVQGAESSPVGAFMREARLPGRAGDKARARITAGTVALTAGAVMVARGAITGRGPDFGTAERQQWLEEGNRPYTINLPGIAPIEYKLLQPIAFPLAVIADTMEGAQSGEGDTLAERMSDAAGKSWTRAGTSLISQSYFDAMFDIYTDFERGNFGGVQRILQSFLPLGGATRDVTRVIDPTLREPGTFLQKVKSELPFASRTVPPRRGRFGEPVQREGSRFGSLLADPLRTAATPLIGSDRPVVDPLVADLAERGIRFGKRSSTLVKKGVDLLKPFGADQASEFRNLLQGARGTALRTSITQLMATSAFQQSTKEAQNEQIQKVITNLTRQENRKIFSPADALTDFEAFQRLIQSRREADRGQ